MKLPEWAVREEIYNPGSDRDYFISRSLLKIVSILTALRGQGLRPVRPIGAAPALLAALVLIALIVMARTTAFLWAVLAGELVLLCFQPGRPLRRALGAPWQRPCSVPSSSPRLSSWAMAATPFSCPARLSSP